MYFTIMCFTNKNAHYGGCTLHSELKRGEGNWGGGGCTLHNLENSSHCSLISDYKYDKISSIDTDSYRVHFMSFIRLAFTVNSVSEQEQKTSIS
jgi:hypothetical protein